MRIFSLLLLAAVLFASSLSPAAIGGGQPGLPDLPPDFFVPQPPPGLIPLPNLEPWYPLPVTGGGVLGGVPSFFPVSPDADKSLACVFHGSTGCQYANSPEDFSACKERIADIARGTPREQDRRECDGVYVIRNTPDGPKVTGVPEPDMVTVIPRFLHQATQEALEAVRSNRRLRQR